MIGTLEEYVTRAGWRFYTDREIVESENYSEMRLRLERVHNAAHNYIGGVYRRSTYFIQRPFCISHPFKCR